MRQGSSTSLAVPVPSARQRSRQSLNRSVGWFTSLLDCRITHGHLFISQMRSKPYSSASWMLALDLKRLLHCSHRMQHSRRINIRDTHTSYLGTRSLPLIKSTHRPGITLGFYAGHLRQSISRRDAAEGRNIVSWVCIPRAHAITCFSLSSM